MLASEIDNISDVELHDDAYSTVEKKINVLVI